MKERGWFIGSFFFVLSCLLAGLIYAQMTRAEVTAEIPFSFVLEKTSLPAGSYTLVQTQDDPYVWYITDIKGAVKVIFDTETAEAMSRPGAFVITFNEYGGKYFLSKIWLEGDKDGFSIPKGPEEKALMKAGHKPKVHSISIKKK